jgi:hypothetical protein
MQIIKINPQTHTVSLVEYSGDYNELYTLLECEVFELALHIDECNVLMVDEEGLLNDAENRIGVFRYCGNVYVGHGLVLGNTDEGDDREPSMTVTQVREYLEWGHLEMRAGGIVVFVSDEDDEPVKFS